MAYGDRKSERVDFERGIHVHIMGIDGTWRRDCMMIDVSQTGARLRIEGSLRRIGPQGVLPASVVDGSRLSPLQIGTRRRGSNRRSVSGARQGQKEIAEPTTTRCIV